MKYSYNYNEVLNMVNNLLTEYDLVGLIYDKYEQIDEYINEAKKIVEFLKVNEDSTLEELTVFIKNTFTESFTTFYFDIQECRSIAYTILKIIK